MPTMRNSSEADASHYMTTDRTTESSVPYFTRQLMRDSHGITSESSDYSEVIIIVAILIFVVAIIIAIFIMLMQRRNHRKKLLLAAEIEKEEQDERRRRHAKRKQTAKRTPRRKRGRRTTRPQKFSKPKTKEEMMMELSDFLETHSKKYRAPDEATIGSAEPSPAPTPTVTPALLSSEVDVSLKSPVAVDSRLSKLSSVSKKPHFPEVYEKEVIYLTPSTEWGEKSEKKSAEAPSIPVTPPSKSASPTHMETVVIGTRQATPSTEQEELKESKSRELRSWNLGSAEKEGYSEDRALEPWEEENLQHAEKAEKEDEGLQRPSQENVASKE